MTSGINYFFENYTNLPLATFKVFYDFAQSGSGVVQSVPFANSGYSGTVNAYNSDFWNYSGSGFFTGGQYITINNSSSGLFSGSNLSFLTVAQKAAKTNNVLFSCADTGLVGASFAYRGFTFGINAANKLYFEYYGPSGVEISTLPTILAERNSISVVLGQDTVMLGQYDFFNSQLNSQTFPINSDYIFNGDTWQIGHSDSLPYANECGFTGWMSDFLIFNTSLTASDVSYLNSGVVSNISSTNVTSGTIQIMQTTGTLTGLVSSFSGITGYSAIQTGNLIDEFGNYYVGFIGPTPLTGVIYLSGVTFQSGIVNTTILTGGAPTTTVDWDYVQTFGYDAVSYLFSYDNNSDVSSCYFATCLFNELSGVRLGQNSAYNMVKSNNNSNYTSGILVFNNFVYQNSGVIVSNGNLYAPVNTLEFDYTLTGFNVNSTGNYSISDEVNYDYVPLNQQVVITGYSHAGSGYFWDTVSDSWDSAPFSWSDGVTGLTQISGASSNSVIYYNGQKLMGSTDYSSVENGSSDYLLSGSGAYFLNSTDLFGGSTGNLTVTQIPSYFVEIRGSDSSIFGSGKFIPSYTMLFLNGIRQKLSESYLEVSSVDKLLPGGNFILQPTVIYNNSDLFFS
jgi:hypothetical protein